MFLVILGCYGILNTKIETSEMIEKYKANEEKTEGFWNRLRSMFR